MLVDVDIFRSNVNGRGSAVAIDGHDRHASVRSRSTSAGTGEARFKDIAIKDLARRITPAEQTASRFRAQHFEDFYYGWSAAAGDFNHDGVLDVTIGNRYYLGPSFTESREVYAGQAYNPAKEYSPAMVNFAFDYTGDGWDDILVVESRTPVLYVNPKGESRRWTRHAVFTTPVTSESIMFKDINGDGKPDAIYGGRQFRAMGERGSGESDRAVEDLHRLAARRSVEHPRHRRRRHQRRRQGGHHRAARLVGAAGRRAPRRRHGRSIRARSAATATPAATWRSTTSTATSCRTS